MSLNSKLRCVVVDDEPPGLELISDYVNRSADLELCGSFSNPLELLLWLQKNTIDIIFLDIQMPELSGIQVKKLLSSEIACVICSAYPDYAIEGFEQNVQDYIMKPASYERFRISIDRCTQYLSALKKTETTSDRNQHIFVRSEHRLIRISFDEILYFQGLRDYVSIFTKTKRILTLQSMKSFETELPLEQFIRVHKSYIVAISAIKYIERNRVFIGDTIIPVGDTYRAEFNRILKI